MNVVEKINLILKKANISKANVKQHAACVFSRSFKISYFMFESLIHL